MITFSGFHCTLNFIGLTQGGRRESKFGEVALSIVQILETFRRQDLAGRSPGRSLEPSSEEAPEQYPEQSSPISIAEVKEILSSSAGGLNSYLKNFQEMTSQE